MGRFLVALFVSVIFWPLTLMANLDDSPDMIPLGLYLISGIGIFFLWAWTYKKGRANNIAYVYALVTTVALGALLPFLFSFLITTFVVHPQ